MSEDTPGPLADEKQGETSDPGHAQPEAMEVESARLLEMDAADRLEADGMPREEISRLADEYIALDLGTDTDGFIAWVRDRRSS